MSTFTNKLPGPGFLWPGAVVAVWSLYAVLNYTAPLDSPRPQQLPGGEAEAPAEDSVRTPFVRLWDDPLGPSYFAPGSVKDTSKNAPFEFDDDLLLLPVCLPGGPGSEARETRLRMRNAILAALTTAKYSPLSSERLKHLAADLKPAPREEPGTSQTTPTPAASIIVPYERFRQDETDALYDPDDKPHFGEVVVCWVDESRLGNRPLESLGRLLQSVIDQCSLKGSPQFQQAAAPTRAARQVCIVGPSCTDALMAMASDWTRLRELPQGLCPPDMARFRIELNEQARSPFPLTMLMDPATNQRGYLETTFYSARATVEPAALKHHAKTPVREFLHPTLPGAKPPPSDEPPPAPDHTECAPPFSFVRVIGTDWHLAHTIRRELEQRNQWPHPLEQNECVVLITERDTLYGRALPNLCRFLFPEGDLKQPAPLVAFKYLRGIDGKRTDATVAPRAASGDGSAAASDTPSGFNPTGTAQLDYLRRLETQLVALHQHQRRAGGRGILAIGVTGTDVYDKLLILRALRNRFPDVCFFTTDLDAEFWRPSELRYTQNLIVAAHFGLQLHPSLQRDVLPFRDSYQTSCFLATLLAVDDQRAAELWRVAKQGNFWPEPPLRPDDQKKVDAEQDEAKQREIREGAFEWFEQDPYAEVQGDPASTGARNFLQPLSFEIGLRGAYQMTLTGAVIPPTPAFHVPAYERQSLSALVQPPSPREWRHYPLGWWLALAGCVLLLPMFVPQVRRLLLPQPHPAAQRWTLLIGCVVAGGVVCCAALAFTIHHSHHHAPDGEPFVCFEGLSVWPSTLIRLLAVVLSGCFAIKAYKDLAANGERLFGRTYVALDSNNQTAPESWKDRVRRITTLDWRPVRNSDALLQEYAVKCHWSSRAIRVTSLTVGYMVFGFLLFVMAETFPNCPARNQYAAALASAFTILSVVACVFLAFFTVDAIHLCKRFVQLVGSGACIWPSQTLEAVTPGHTGPDEDRQSLATIRVIGQRTNEVSKVQLYPFIALLILICARYNRFDGWNLPWPLLTVVLLQFLVLILSSLALRKAAAEARRLVLGRLQTASTNAIGSDGPREKQLQKVTADIQQESDGAYRPLGDDYLFRALAIPFGGTGGLLLLEQFITWF